MIGLHSRAVPTSPDMLETLAQAEQIALGTFEIWRFAALQCRLAFRLLLEAPFSSRMSPREQRLAPN